VPSSTMTFVSHQQVAAPNRIAFMEGLRGGFVDDLRSGIASDSVGKEGGRIGLSISFTNF
jgi:hypothetical protein